MRAVDEIRHCLAENQQAHADVLNTYEAAARAGRINPGEAEQFSAIEAHLRNLRTGLARDGLPLQECLRIGTHQAWPLSVKCGFGDGVPKRNGTDG